MTLRKQQKRSSQILSDTKINASNVAKDAEDKGVHMENQKNILDYDTVALDEAQDAVIIIDQTLLPGKIELIALHTAQEMWDAIYLLKVRGAPAIGVAAALGIYLLANRIETEDFEEFYQKFTEYKEYLDSSRPTAVNLSWALKRMDAVAVKAGREEHKTVAKVKEILHDEALQIRAEDVEVCRKSESLDWNW